MENFLTSLQNKYLIILSFIGLVLLGIGVFYVKSGVNFSSTKVEVLGTDTQKNNPQNITVEISGEVEKPGVYELLPGSRINDLLVLGGGLTAKADRIWVDRYLNKAAKLTDGQKIYIPQSGAMSANSKGGDQSGSSINSTDSKGLININTATLGELDSLPGIGQVYGQNIIEHRPYSTLTELVSKGAIKESLYEKIKNLISVY